MTAGKTIHIQDIQDGQKVRGLFLVKEMSRAETKAGKPYLVMTLMDATGEIGARVWENADRLQGECPAGAVIMVSGQAQAYKSILQLRIDSLSRAKEGEYDLSRFVPTSRHDIRAMAREITRIAAEVKEPHLRDLLAAFFKNKKFMAQFTQAPAAKTMHHAYVGGLLEHTLAIAKLADRVCGLYPAIDRSLLLAGALLHDIGKIKEFDFDRIPADYSVEGRLVGHMVLGIEMMRERIAAIKGFPPELAARLKHLILSHHGRHEFGSPALPMMLEAFVLNFLDDLDAKANYFERLGAQARQEGYQWSEYQRNLERFLYIRPPAASPSDAGDGDAPDIDPRQQKLFDL